MNKLIYPLLALGMLMSTHLLAQVDSVQTVDLLSEINATQSDTVTLLPRKMVITQRLLWGKKGLMRSFDRFELTPEKRQKELKLRRTMLVIHQVLGMLTMGGMVGQGIVGAKLYQGDRSLLDLHEALAVGINAGYFTTAGMSLFAPPKMLDERKGISSIKLHKALAVIHLSGMITTNILADQLQEKPSLRPYHRAAAYTTFGAFATAMIVIRF